MQIQEILIVKNAHENYGISTESINQISRVPSLMPLPLRPSGVRGLCSVSGNVVAMVDMNLLLGLTDVDLADDKGRIISLNDELSSNTLLVSDVYNTVEIDQNNIEYLDNEYDPVIAIYKYGEKLIQVISLEKLFQKINRVEIEAKEVTTGKIKSEVIREEESSRFLIFSMSNEKYALEIDYLQEIILADREYTSVAGTNEELLGLITLRDDLLMVIDLRVHYGFKPRHNEQNRILIVSYNGRKIGLCIDSIIDIQKFYKKDIEYMKDTFKDNKVAGVIHGKDSLISFFDATVIENIFDENDSFVDKTSDIIEETKNESYPLEVIVFKLNEKEYAFNIESVDEIIDIVSSTSVAFTDESVEGIINIRGQIVTTVSLYEKLNFVSTVDEDSKIIVCNIDGNRIGFIVNSVSDIIGIKEDEIVEQNEGYFNHIFHLEGGERLVLSIDIDKLLLKD
jgi:purine-binding chemotaxis protein CheW